MGRYSFDVELFHLLLRAGLSRRISRVRFAASRPLTASPRGLKSGRRSDSRERVKDAKRRSGSLTRSRLPPRWRPGAVPAPTVASREGQPFCLTRVSARYQPANRAPVGAGYRERLRRARSQTNRLQPGACQGREATKWILDSLPAATTLEAGGLSHPHSCLTRGPASMPGRPSATDADPTATAGVGLAGS